MFLARCVWDRSGTPVSGLAGLLQMAIFETTWGRPCRRVQAAKILRPHPRLPGRYAQRVLLPTGELIRRTVPPLTLRWAPIAAHHDRPGHAGQGVSQTFASMRRVSIGLA